MDARRIDLEQRIVAIRPRGIQGDTNAGCLARASPATRPTLRRGFDFQLRERIDLRFFKCGLWQGIGRPAGTRRG